MQLHSSQNLHVYRFFKKRDKIVCRLGGVLVLAWGSKRVRGHCWPHRFMRWKPRSKRRPMARQVGLRSSLASDYCLYCKATRENLQQEVS